MSSAHEPRWDDVMALVNEWCAERDPRGLLSAHDADPITLSRVQSEYLSGTLDLYAAAEALIDEVNVAHVEGRNTTCS